MIIPAIDLIDGQTVRLYQGSYDQTTHYSQTPFELRDLYAKAGSGGKLRQRQPVRGDIGKGHPRGAQLLQIFFPQDHGRYSRHSEM